MRATDFPDTPPKQTIHTQQKENALDAERKHSIPEGRIEYIGGTHSIPEGPIEYIDGTHSIPEGRFEYSHRSTEHTRCKDAALNT